MLCISIIKTGSLHFNNTETVLGFLTGAGEWLEPAAQVGGGSEDFSLIEKRENSNWDFYYSLKSITQPQTSPTSTPRFAVK